MTCCCSKQLNRTLLLSSLTRNRGHGRVELLCKKVRFSKMSRDAFLSEALYEADKALEKFA